MLKLDTLELNDLFDLKIIFFYLIDQLDLLGVGSGLNYSVKHFFFNLIGKMSSFNAN